MIHPQDRQMSFRSELITVVPLTIVILMIRFCTMVLGLVAKGVPSFRKTIVLKD